MINFLDINNRKTLINLERNSLNSTLIIQENLNKQILSFMKNFFGNMNINMTMTEDSDFINYMNKSTFMLNKSNINLFSIQKLIQKLENIQDSLNESNIEDLIKDYNNQFNKCIKVIYRNTSMIEKFIESILLLDMSELSTSENTEKKSNLQESSNESIQTITSDCLKDSYIENTLIISEINKKVILPYKIKEVKQILFEHKDLYKSLNDVIEKLYTKPISYYRFSAFSRFKETYKLMRKKENANRFKSISLATELLTNYNLHPAIITSCRTLNELDIYLACLEENALQDFRYFDIKYEIPPTIVSNSLKNELA